MPENRPVTLADGSVIHSDSEILGGTPVFVGTRVPVQTLVDYFEGGYSSDEFLDNFPSVRREQVNAFLVRRTLYEEGIPQPSQGTLNPPEG
jgi:uncharacterized protein (DUF433 family)